MIISSGVKEAEGQLSEVNLTPYDFRNRQVCSVDFQNFWFFLMIMLVYPKEALNPKIGVQSLTGAEQERFQFLGPFSPT